MATSAERTKIATNATKAKKSSAVNVGSTEVQSMDDLIKADRYLRAEEAASSNTARRGLIINRIKGGRSLPG